jgi:aspartate aminotransferase
MGPVAGVREENAMSINQQSYDYGASKSSIREIAAYGAARKAQIGAQNVYDFSLGNPSVPAPDAVRDSIAHALTLPATVLHGYTPANGLPAARRAVAESLNRRFGTSYGADDLYLTCGAAASISIVLNAVCNEGDEVIVVAPYFPEYKVFITNAGATCVEVMADPDTFQIDVDAVSAAICGRTAAVMIDSPNNPVGSVYARANLEALAAVLDKRSQEIGHPIYLISDEPYREIAYDVEVPWVPDLYDRTVVCYSYSKSLSLPGERIGWALVPNTNPEHDLLVPAVAGAGRKMGFVCAPALFQRVLIDCVDEPTNIEAYTRNRKALTEGLSAIGYEFIEPQGAFYLWMRALEPDANAFFERAKGFELLPVPSDSFGCPGWVRVGYCVSYETIVNSMPAWQALWDSYKA